MKSGALLPMKLLICLVLGVLTFVTWLSLNNPEIPAGKQARSPGAAVPKVFTLQENTVDAEPLTLLLHPPSRKIRHQNPTVSKTWEIAILQKQETLDLGSIRGIEIVSPLAKNTEIHELTKIILPLAKEPLPRQKVQKPAPPVATRAFEKRQTRLRRSTTAKPLAKLYPDDPLMPVPGLELVQSTAIDPLPQVRQDSRKPLNVYAKPFNRADKRPRIGIVVMGLGLSDAATESAIQGLPGGVTLAFSPHSSRLNEWIRLARAGGHEVLINVPMEAINYPDYDPGPQALLTSLNTNRNLERLFWALNRATGYVGIVDYFGSRFTTSRQHMKPVLRALKRRGLLYLDSGSAAHSIAPIVARDLRMAFAVSRLTLDEKASRKEIDRKFGELEKLAQQETQAIGIASSYPVTLERIASWTRQIRARGIALAPITALTLQPDL